MFHRYDYFSPGVSLSIVPECFNSYEPLQSVIFATISSEAGEQKGQVTGSICSPHFISECMAGRAPPPDGNVVLPALRIVDPDIGPGHMLLPCPGIPGDRQAVIRAERAFTHTTNPCGDGTINFLTGGSL
jgi:hypothetical protein